MKKVFNANEKQKFRKTMKDSIEELVTEIAETMIRFQQGGQQDLETIEYRLMHLAQKVSDTAEKEVIKYLKLQDEDNKQES